MTDGGRNAQRATREPLPPSGFRENLVWVGVAMLKAVIALAAIYGLFLALALGPEWLGPFSFDT